MNAVIVLCVTISAVLIHQCYSTAEATLSINGGDMCIEKTCNRSIDAAGKKVIAGCPGGCLCVFNVSDVTYPANGTCYQLATTTTNRPGAVMERER
uniref:Complement inhibitor RaCI5 n=1 Tax=Rhipicephalus appendiculatus TaxID=34631 RepID=C5I5_RHIAP|nr:RecName: Full=Complement inhibitor RaCI5; AltName: Full=Rhipicephalus appendiculatus complement inhibitor 5; Flags: Precursor [Rhipicephalus appendiculatus]AML25524.1 complement inhibitor RaCI5 precursor [Rhipicephalus appendiculatus]